MIRRMQGMVLGLALLFGAQAARAIEVKVSAMALERTLQAQLFNGPEGRHYVKGDATSPCYVYAEQPHVTFKDDRIWVHVHVKAKLGTAVHGNCLGVTLATDADVSFIPEAEEESVGFRDARVESLSESKDLNFLLVPFLSKKLPSQMKVNAAELMRKVLAQSMPATGYTLTLDNLKLHSMLVEHGALAIDLDAALSLE
jgi:hypothetical protein